MALCFGCMDSEPEEKPTSPGTSTLRKQKDLPQQQLKQQGGPSVVPASEGELAPEFSQVPGVRRKGFQNVNLDFLQGDPYLM